MFLGRTLGRVVTLSSAATSEVHRHEVIHTLQSRQVGVVAPAGTVGALAPGLRRTSWGGRVSWDVRTGLGTAVLGGVDFLVLGYRGSLAETEAYSLD